MGITTINLLMSFLQNIERSFKKCPIVTKNLFENMRLIHQWVASLLTSQPVIIMIKIFVPHKSLIALKLTSSINTIIIVIKDGLYN